MRQVAWTDEQGWQHKSLVKDTDPDDAAPYGLLQDPPDVTTLDWAGVQNDLHNELSAQGLLTWADIEQAQGALASIAREVLVHRLRELYETTRTSRPTG